MVLIDRIMVLEIALGFCHGSNEVEDSMNWHIICARQCFGEYIMKLQC